VPVPNHCGFSLVGYSDARNVVCAKPTLLCSFFNYFEGASNDLHRVVLNPSRTWKDLLVFSLSHRYHTAAAIEDHEASARGALVQRRDVSSSL
jgi:hypothetical protein